MLGGSKAIVEPGSEQTKDSADQVGPIAVTMVERGCRGWAVCSDSHSDSNLVQLFELELFDLL